MSKLTNQLLLCGVLASSYAAGFPSGLKPLPVDVTIPTYQGQTLPVHLIPDSASETSVYVVPTQGMTLKSHLVANGIADCDAIKGELNIARNGQRVREGISQMLVEARAEYENSLQKRREAVRAFEQLTALVTPLQAQNDRLKAAAAKAELEEKQAKTNLGNNRDERRDETEKDAIAELDKAYEELKKELVVKRKERVKAVKAYTKVQNELEAYELELADKKGRKAGIEKTLTVELDELDKIMARVASLDEVSEKVLKRYSTRPGGTFHVTSDFAPAAYLAALKEANPAYQFQYVPSVTARIDMTIPDSVLPGGPLAGRVGSMIIDANWSDKDDGQYVRTFTRKLIDKSLEVGADPVKLAQNRIPELQSSLVGAKFARVDLSILGYCALRKPEALAGEFQNGAAQAFSVALKFTYPVNYELKVGGSYNTYESLYEFHKMTKSSSWFGLSSSQREEYIRRTANEKMLKVTVKPIGAELSLEDSMLLSEKVKEQLLFFAAQPYLDFGPVSSVKAGPPPELGASKVGARLMTIPNPWAFWGGLVLSSLGEMFGSSSSETSQDISKRSEITLNYESGFQMLHPVSLAVGDLESEAAKGEGNEK